MDVPIGLNVGLTLFTGALAVGFTFISLGKDILRKSYIQSFNKETLGIRSASAVLKDEDAALPLLEHDLNSEESIAPSNPAAALQRRLAGRPSSNLVFTSDPMTVPGLDRAEDIQQPNLTLVSAPSGSGSGEGSMPNTE